MEFPFYHYFADRMPAADAENTQFFIEFVVDARNAWPPIAPDMDDLRRLVGSGASECTDRFWVQFRKEQIEIQRLPFPEWDPEGPVHIMSNPDFTALLAAIEPRFDDINWEVFGWILPADFSTELLTPLAYRIAELVGGDPKFPTRPGKKRPAWEPTRRNKPRFHGPWSFAVTISATSSLHVTLDDSLRGTCILKMTSQNSPVPDTAMIEETLAQATARQGNIITRRPTSPRNTRFWGREPTPSDEFFGVSAVHPDLANRYIVPQPCQSLWVSTRFSRTDQLVKDCPPDAAQPGTHGYWIDPIAAREVLARYVPQLSELDQLLTLT